MQALFGKKAHGSSPHRSSGHTRSDSPPVTRTIAQYQPGSPSRLAPGVASSSTGHSGALAVKVLAGSRHCENCGGMYYCNCASFRQYHTDESDGDIFPKMKEGPFDLKNTNPKLLHRNIKNKKVCFMNFLKNLSTSSSLLN